jgi:beta-galactosidase/beta-glucuronidase
MNLAELDELVESGYPRPGLARQDWTDLSGPWEFAFDDNDVGLDAGWPAPGKGPFDRTIIVPYPPESRASGIDEPGFHPVVWYRRRVVFPQIAPGHRLLLHFGAVDYEAMVFVDGALVGSHQGGHTPFSIDVTASAGGREAVIVVRARDQPQDVHQPRGKQDWHEHPHQIWYKRTTGVWQPVWLEVVPREHIVGLDIVSDLHEATVSVRVELAGEVSGAWISLRLLFGEEVLAEQRQRVAERHERVVLTVPALENSWDSSRLQWSPESPQLLSLELSLVPDDNVGADTVSSYLGIRSVGAADRHFLINGHPEQLRMVLSQGYWPESHLAAPQLSSAREEVELIKALGFNGARLHQKVEDPRLLYWADRLGLMVWEEMPSCGAFSSRAMERSIGEWLEVVKRDRNHPCIVAWVIFNESWGIPALGERIDHRHLALGAYHLTRALDPTRLVILNDGWEHTESDIWGIHDYTSTGDELKRRYGDSEAIALSLGERWPAGRRVLLKEAVDRGQPIVLSEFGGVSLVTDEDGSWHGYTNARNPDELAGRLADLFAAVHACKGLAGFCYTQFADTEQERNGLVSAERKPKVAAEKVRSIVEGRRVQGPTEDPGTHPV